ncbi:helicase-associated domain-containing protein [Streptomyces sp. AA0539]|uniref:helicase-associated domain-containing protein n=1 Tax=Streptomyces sp. AA0539 TaxID=1210045 RepID=UPI000302C89D|nr:helicase-associated domain-containing protein [Streptomyces sp. AA0539]
MTTEQRPRPPRTLAEELRSRGDEELTALLRARADLLSPLPGDVSQLATRAGTRASVVRALERLDVFTLQVAEALAVAPQPCPYDTLAALLPGGERELPDALARLRGRALLWGAEHEPRLVRTAQEVLAPTAARPGGTGLGPTVAEACAGISPRRVQELLTGAGLPATGDPVSAVTALTGLFADEERFARLLAAAPPGAREALDRLAWGPPYGEVSARPGPQLRWLLDRGLLLPTQPGTVVLPREVALRLRGGRAHRELRPRPPEVTARATYTPGVADAAGAGAAQGALGVIEELLTGWAAEPPPVLRTGGVGVRELKRTAVALDVPEPQAAFWAELAYAAGLVAGDGEVDERYAPTPAYDAWAAEPGERRWARLVGVWLTGTRVPGLVGDRDGKGRTLTALGPGLDRGPAAELRRRVLELLAALPEGTAPDPAAVRDRIGWELPRRMTPEARDALCAAVLAEADLLGVTGRGALTSYGRALLAAAPADGGLPADSAPMGSVPPGSASADSAPSADSVPLYSTPAGTAPAADREAGAARLLAPLLPEELDHFLLQADLTAVAPGPLSREPAQAMALIADIESKGGATVYRFTPASVRRALDAGWTPDALHGFLAEHSRTPVPQPLTYLVDDVARRHGRLRVGVAAGYLRCEDEALLTQVLADRRAEQLRLRRIAPTVVISGAPPEILLARLRELGLAPAAESAEGAVVTLAATRHRTPPRTAPEPVPDGPPAADDRLLAAAVRAIRAGDRTEERTDEAATAAGARTGARPVPPPPAGALPRTPAADTLATLQAAALSGDLVRIGYVGADGVAAQHILAPVRVEGGFVTAFDHTAEEVRTYPLHRITGTVELPAD